MDKRFSLILPETKNLARKQQVNCFTSRLLFKATDDAIVGGEELGVVERNPSW